jgi:diguanylate cyclase (GGDEF)-like protein
MPETDPLSDPPLADGKLQVQLVANRWLLTVLYLVLTLTGVITADPLWFGISATFLVIYHLGYSWYTWHELTRPSFPLGSSYVVPFIDALAVSLALIAVGDPQHPIWGAYFFVVVGVAFFYHRVIWLFSAWLALNYAMIVVALTLRDVDPNVPYMVVASIILTMALLVLASFTNGERRARRRMAQVARTDPLTGARNRRGLEESLATELTRARAASRTLTLLMIDVDRFKRYNDQFGHLVADGMLEQLIEMLASLLPPEHLVARYGGDEFVILVPGLAVEDAPRLAERLRRQIERSGLCTVSIGWTVYDGGDASGAALLEEADAAMLEAKREGRNCVRAAAAAVRAAA